MMIHKTVKASATQGAVAGTNVFVLSTDELDRDGDRITQNWNLAPFRQNPVVLFGHDKSALPIGKCTDVRVVNGKLTGTIEWPPAGVYHFADQVRGLVEGGFLRSASVGFTAEDSRPNAHGGKDIHAATLLEWSLVNLPSNPSATLQRSAPTMQFKSWLGGAWRPVHDDSSDIVLRLTDHPSHKETQTMRYVSDREVVLRLKDSPTDQSAGSASQLLARYAVERPRDVAEAVRVLGDNASVMELLAYVRRLDQPTARSANAYLRGIADASVAKFESEQRAKRWARALEADLAVPQNKRIKPDFAKVY